MKLYKAKCELEVVFYSDSEGQYDLQGEALKWAIKNEDQSGGAIVNISEVKSLDDLPKSWEGSCTPWGEPDITCSDWFNKKFKINNLKAEIARLTEELDSLTVETADTN